MEKKFLLAFLICFLSGLAAQAQHIFDDVYIKDITRDEESDWQTSQVRIQIIALSHERFELELYDNQTRKTPTLSYEVKFNDTDSAVYMYNIILLNGVQLVNPGPGDFIETTTPLKEMARGLPGTVAINEDVLQEIVIYKME